MTDSNNIETHDIEANAHDELTVSQALELLKSGYAELTPDQRAVYAHQVEVIATLYGILSESGLKDLFERPLVHAALQWAPELAADAQAAHFDEARTDNLLRSIVMMFDDPSHPIIDLISEANACFCDMTGNHLYPEEQPDYMDDPIQTYLDSINHQEGDDLYRDFMAFFVPAVTTGDVGFMESCVEIPLEAAALSDLTKSLRKLSPRSRSVAQWAHNKLLVLIRELTDGQPALLETRLKEHGLYADLRAAVLQQLKTAELARPVFSAEARKFDAYTEKHGEFSTEVLEPLVRLTHADPNHPVRRTFRLLITAIAALLDCAPEMLREKAEGGAADESKTLSRSESLCAGVTAVEVACLSIDVDEFESDGDETLADEDILKEAMSTSADRMAVQEKDIDRFIGCFDDKTSLDQALYPLFCGWVVASAVLNDDPKGFADHTAKHGVPEFLVPLVIPALEFFKRLLKRAAFASSPDTAEAAAFYLKMKGADEERFEKARNHFVSLLSGAIEKAGADVAPVELQISALRLILHFAYVCKENELRRIVKSNCSIVFNENEIEGIVSFGFLCWTGLETFTNERLQQFRGAFPEAAKLMEELAKTKLR